MADCGMDGYRGVLFLYHESTKRVTVKWIGKEVQESEKNLTEKTLLSLFADCACAEDEDVSFEYNTLTVVRTPAEKKENLDVSTDSSADEESAENAASDMGEHSDDSSDDVYLQPCTDTLSPKIESSEQLFDSVSNSDSGVIKMHVDPHTGVVEVEGGSSDQFSTDEEMEILQMIRKSKESASNQPSKVQESRPCKYCGKVFTRRDSLYKHEFIHTGERPHKCALCDKAFTQKPHLKIHLLTHTKERPHKCGICDKSFAHKATLLGHELTHTGEKPYLCPICGKGFKTKELMRRHEAVHTIDGVLSVRDVPGASEPKPRPYQCAVCGKAFGLKRTLANHELTHTGVKAHKCSYCGKAFALKGSMQTHELTHTGEKPHQCPVCDRRFTQLSHLKAHVLTHTGARPHQCTICGKSFALRGNLRAHELTHIKRG